MDFQTIIDRALTIRKLYEEKETRLYGSPWTREEIALGFVGDVGDVVLVDDVDEDDVAIFEDG